MNEQNYCSVCGTKLYPKKCGDEGMVQFCEKCNEFRFPVYNSAVSNIVFNKTMDKILLIQQYGKKNNVLVAGYINRGETPQEALRREIYEEVGLNAIKWDYNESSYFEKSNTLIHNFVTVVDSEDFVPKKDEVDYAQWYTIDEAIKNIMPNSLAEHFLKTALSARNLI